MLPEKVHLTPTNDIPFCPTYLRKCFHSICFYYDILDIPGANEGIYFPQLPSFYDCRASVVRRRRDYIYTNMSLLRTFTLIYSGGRSRFVFLN